VGSWRRLCGLQGRLLIPWPEMQPHLEPSSAAQVATGTFCSAWRACLCWPSLVSASPHAVLLLLHRRQSSKTTPDLVVSSVSLWHLLHVTNATTFGRELGQMGAAARAYREVVRVQPERGSCLGCPGLAWPGPAGAPAISARMYCCLKRPAARWAFW
jgi:hypothetical protein